MTATLAMKKPWHGLDVNWKPLDPVGDVLPAPANEEQLCISPVRKVVVFGGGSRAPPWTNVRKWYVLDAKGKVVPIDDSPVDSYAATSTLFSVEPVSANTC